MKRETEVVHAGRPSEGPLAVPVVLTAPYHGAGYAREEGTPTWEALEAAIGTLEGGESVAFASGMGAIAATLEHLPAGARVVRPAAAYTQTRELLAERAATGRIELATADVTDTEAVLRACEGAALVWVESPTNPAVGIAEVDRICEGAHAAGAEVVVDAPFATPLLQRPLELGADIVLHSATKYLAGHSDVQMGAIVTRDDELYAVLKGRRDLVGAVPGPFEAWLALRGLRTLHLRVERAQANATELASRLTAHGAISEVRYPGFGGIVSIVLAEGALAADLFTHKTKLWVHATSLGGVESTLERRRRWKAEPATIPDGLVRLSVGIEDVEDLWRDLLQALDTLH